MKNILFLFMLLSFVGSAQTIITVAGGGTEIGNGVPATSNSLLTPYNISLDDTGNLYVRCVGSHNIKKIRPAYNGYSYHFAGFDAAGYSGDGGPAAYAKIQDIAYIHTGRDGSVYLSDAYRLRKIGPNGIINTIAGTGVPGYNGDHIPATSAQVNSVASIVTDDTGNVYFNDRSNHRIRKIDTFGMITTVAGNGYIGMTPDGAHADTAKFPEAMTVLVIDKHNNLYYLDSISIRRIDAHSRIVTTVAGNGTSGFSGDGGPATAASIRAGFIAIDTADNIYLATSVYARVRKITPDGIINTIAGSGAVGDSGDGGNPLYAAFGSIQGICVNKDGDVFVSDASNGKVRMITNKSVSVGEASNAHNSQAACISIMPNPAKNGFAIFIEDPLIQDIDVIVSDLKGKTVISQRSKTNQSIRINQELVTGVYLITATTERYKISNTVQIE